MDSGNGIADHRQQDLMVIGIEGRTGSIAPEDLTARHELYVSPVGRLPTLAQSQKNGKVSVRLLLGLAGRHALVKGAIPSNLAGCIKGQGVSHSICPEECDGRQDIPTRRKARHVEMYALEVWWKVACGEAQRVRGDADVGANSFNRVIVGGAWAEAQR